jgi:FecR protein
MRFCVNSLGSFIAAMLVACLMLSPAQAGTKSWHISESSGEVSIETHSGVRAASRGQTLKPGDAVKTGMSGRAVIVRGGEYVIVSPKSRVRITKPEEAGEITQIFQSVGSALFRIEKKETPHFGVKTPYLAAVVKGTTFNVTVTESGATVQVTEGRVEVSTLDGGASDMIVPGRIGRVDADDRQLLKVLGTDEKSIRSPLPATNINSTTPDPSAGNATGGSASSESNGVSSDGNASSASTSNDFSVATSDSDTSGFSGRIGWAIKTDPVSIAMATGGLISGGQAMDRISTRDGSGNSAGNSPKSEPTSGLENNSGSTTGAPPVGNADANPDNKGGVPDDKGGVPEDKGGVPDDKGGVPDDKGSVPDDKGSVPDDKGSLPDDKGGMPDDKGGMPNDKGGVPDDKGGMPDDKGSVPDDKRGVPDNKGGTSGDKGGPPDDKGGNPGVDSSGKGNGKAPKA